MADSDVKFHEIFKYFKVKYFIVHPLMADLVLH